MTTLTSTLSGVVSPAAHDDAVAARRFDWLYTGAACWLLAGLFVDGWAHAHGRTDNTFFTPWHGVMYSGYLAVAVTLLGYAWRRGRDLTRLWQNLPAGYDKAFVGLVIFAAGGVGDLVWHTVFGVEANTEILFSPSHLALALGIFLIVGGPLNAAWHRRRDADPRGNLASLPLLLSFTFMWSMLTLITAYAHPYLNTYATLPSKAEGLGRRQRADLYLTTPGGLQARLVGATAPGEQLYGASFSPDGQRLAYVRETRDQVTGDSHAEIYTLNVPTGLDQNSDAIAGQPLTHDSPGLGAALPAWSPDGKQIAYFGGERQKTDIYLMDADGANVRQLTSGDDDDWGAAWSPDGTELAYVSNHGGPSALWIMSTDGQNAHAITAPGGEVAWPAWMPDGRNLVFGRRGGERWSLHVVGADGKNERPLVDTPAEARRPAISADGRTLYFVSEERPEAQSDLYSLPLDANGDVPAGAVRRNLTASPGIEEGGRHGVAVSPRGGALVYSGTPNLARNEIAVDFSPDLGAAGVLIQAALLIGLLLAVLLRFDTPFGFFTFALALNAALMSALGDNYRFIATAAIGGLVADLLVRRLKPSTADPRSLRLIAFIVPAALYLAYFASFILRGEMGWAIHMWTGVSVAAGIVGWMLAELMLLGLGRGKQLAMEAPKASG